MGGGTTNDPAVVSAFHRALLHEGLVVAGLLIAVLVAWNLLRGAQLRLATEEAADDDAGARPPSHPAEPAARRLLRVAFGLLWIFDGVLQGQASMPAGLVPQVIRPAAATSPLWVRHVVNWGASVWSDHPATAAAAAVWIQLGIGAWLLVGPRGNWSRAAGLVSAGWGVLVWVFGEAFGGVFAPGLTALFGAPGAVIFYVVAGGLVALPETAWHTARLGRLILRAAGAFLLAMAVLQAWPGRGFWQGAAGHPGSLTSLVEQMAAIPQPGVPHSVVSAFADFDAAHGWGVNLFAVAALAALGVAFLTARPAVVRAALVAAVVLCVADWILVEDLGFLGGVGTDPNSMLPMALLLGSGYLALSPPPAADVAVETKPWRQRLAAEPAYTLRAVAGLAAVGIILVGAAPLAVAAAAGGSSPRAAAAEAGPIEYGSSG